MKEATKDTLTLMTWQLGIIVFFSYIYAYVLDESDWGEPMDFEKALYFSTISSASIGYGDVTGKSKRARRVIMLHALSVFLVFVPLVESRIR